MINLLKFSSPLGTLAGAAIAEAEHRPDGVDPHTLYRQGMRHAVDGKYERAAEILSKVLVQEPGNAEAHNNLALVLQRLGHLDEAIASFRRALVIRPRYAIALTNLGAALAAIGRQNDAIECYTQALKHQPDNLAALNNLGSALHATGRRDDAADCFKAALALDPHFTDAEINLGNVLRDCGRADDAIPHYQAALALRPGDAETHLSLAHLLRNANRLDDAVVHFRRSCELNMGSSDAHAGLGQILQEIGRIDDARLSFRRAIAADPNALDHYLSLAHITQFVPGDPDLAALLRVSGEIGSLSDDDQITAHFALGKALADIGQHDDSFAHFMAGNALRRRITKYDQDRFLRGLQQIKDTFTKAYLEALPTLDRCSDLPIFIVGMPRSGSTLIEQVLASHPEVVCAGETNAFREALQDKGEGMPDWLNPNPLFIPSKEQLSEIAKAYLDSLTKVAPNISGKRNYTRITDKMLSNYRYIGLITKLFPNAKIVHAVRDPVETCLSCFSINFVNQPFAFDLQELGEHYRGYSILMRHWRNILPNNAIFEVRYEALVQNFEESAKRIVAYCGLEWDDRCLRFYEAERPVRTASVEQVRRPIYKSSVRRWRPDDETLHTLLKGLGMARDSDMAQGNRSQAGV